MAWLGHDNHAYRHRGGNAVTPSRSLRFSWAPNCRASSQSQYTTIHRSPDSKEQRPEPSDECVPHCRPSLRTISITLFAIPSKALGNSEKEERRVPMTLARLSRARSIFLASVLCDCFDGTHWEAAMEQSPELRNRPRLASTSDDLDSLTSETWRSCRFPKRFQVRSKRSGPRRGPPLYC